MTDAPIDDGRGTADGGHAAENVTTARPHHLKDAAALNAFVAEHDLALVEFYTEGCGKCASMEPVLGNVARATDAAVGLCNPRDDPALIERFAIRRVPTLVLFRDGEEVDRVDSGFVPTADVVAFVESV